MSENWKEEEDFFDWYKEKFESDPRDLSSWELDDAWQEYKKEINE